VEHAAAAVEIPVSASFTCVAPGGWIEQPREVSARALASGV
jgi:hypothetical protein